MHTKNLHFKHIKKNSKKNSKTMHPKIQKNAKKMQKNTKKCKKHTEIAKITPKMPKMIYRG